jgi:ribosomal protein S17
VHSVGDIVRIQECRPVSKLKSWEVLAEASQ